jgi:hypothetical protein
MPLLDFMKMPVRVLVFLGAFGAVLTLFPLLGVQATHLEIAVIGLFLGTFALLSGITGTISAIRAWAKASGGSEDLIRTAFAVVVIAIGAILMGLGVQAALALSPGPAVHHTQSGEAVTYAVWSGRLS